MKYKNSKEHLEVKNKTISEKSETVIKRLEEYLCKSSVCADSVEANIISTQILEESGITFESSQILTPMEINRVANILDQYIGFDSNELALETTQNIFCLKGDGNKTDDSSDDENEMLLSTSTDEDIDQTEYLAEGECELCERNMRLTRHHLIPKTTHSKLKKRLLHAHASPTSEKSIELLNHFDNYPNDNFTNKSINSFLSRACNVCRPCHSHLHKLHDEFDLALNYNTVDKLLEDEDMRKFCMWSNKQKVGAGSSRCKHGHLRYKR